MTEERAAPGRAELEAAGLYDPDAGNADEVLELLEYLVGLGATIDDLLATKPDELPVLASTLGIWGDRERFTLAEAAVEAGVEPALIARTWRAAGFPEPGANPDVRQFSRGDVEILTILRAAVDLLGEDVAVQMTRVLGAAAARVADASVSAFVVNVLPQATEQDASGLALARANAESLIFIDGMTSAFDTFLRHHIELGFRPPGSPDATAGIDLVRRSVGFADLVDSTAWTQRVELPELSRALTTFDSTASEIVVERGGRVVKLIGDSVMFVAPEPATAVDIALALVDAFHTHDLLPPVRTGVATGEVLAREGDFSGQVVNLAARAVSVARPSTLLVDSETRASVEDSGAFSCRGAGAFALKGFDRRVPLARVRRTDAGMKPEGDVHTVDQVIREFRA